MNPPPDIPSIRTLSLLLPSLTPYISTQEREQSTFVMSSTGQATSSPSTAVQSIIDALADYTKVTGIDLSNNPFAAAIEHSNSPEAILELLQEREKAFKEYRDGNRSLISCLRPAVKVIHSFSGILGDVVSLVSHTCHPNNSFHDFVRSRFLQQTPCSRGSIPSLLYVPRIHFSTDSPVTNEYARPLVGLHRVMMPFSSCSNPWGASSSAWRYIRRFHQIR